MATNGTLPAHTRGCPCSSTLSAVLAGQGGLPLDTLLLPWCLPPTLLAAALCAAMQGGDDDDDHEFFYVVLELPEGHLSQDETYQLIGLDTPTPILKLGNAVFSV